MSENLVNNISAVLICTDCGLCSSTTELLNSLHYSNDAVYICLRGSTNTWLQSANIIQAIAGLEEDITTAFYLRVYFDDYNWL